MNLEQKIQKILEEFDKIYGYNEPDGTRGIMWHPIEDKEDIFQFLSSSLRKIAIESVEAVRVEKRETDIGKALGDYEKFANMLDGGECFKNRTEAFNEAIESQEKKAKEWL